jgi:tRNA threonylcarbamoyladenosine biosynthesis protein TsaB
MIIAMIRGLAIETSGKIGSIATVRDGNVLREEQFQHGLQHAAQIVPIMDRLCREEAWKPSEIEHLYVSAGPGSFTGLRVGITLAKTMALATGVKVLAVPTARVLAENSPPGARQVIVVLDAKRDQIFTARFERDDAGGWIEREPAHLDSLIGVLERAPRPVHLIGEGIPYHRQFIPADESIIVTTDDCWRARAASVARLGWSMAERQQWSDPLTLSPIYIRLPEAEEKRLIAEGKFSPPR